jgi:hypothetical protein
MKIFLKNLLLYFYLVISTGILMTAIVYPFALSFDDGPPLWTCWILYPITLIIMASMQQIIKWAKSDIVVHTKL